MLLGSDGESTLIFWYFPGKMPHPRRSNPPKRTWRNRGRSSCKEIEALPENWSFNFALQETQVRKDDATTTRFADLVTESENGFCCPHNKCVNVLLGKVGVLRHLMSLAS